MYIMLQQARSRLSALGLQWPSALLRATQQEARRHVGVSQTSPTKLDQVMRVDELAKHTPEEVAHIWLEYHGDPSTSTSTSGEGSEAAVPAGGAGRVGSVLSADDWELMQERGKKSPMFVLPMGKGHKHHGKEAQYVTLLVQQQLPITLITSLEEFRRYGPSAPPAMAVTHYPELVDSKGLVLVRGDIVNDKLITPGEARTVLQLLRAFYTDHEDYKMVLDFNHQPNAFDFTALLKKLKLA